MTTSKQAVSKRQLALAAALAATIAATLWAAQSEDEEPVQPSAGARRAAAPAAAGANRVVARPSAAASAPLRFVALQRAPWPAVKDSELAAWMPPAPPPPPPPPPPAPPPPPVAPAFPYQLIGRLEEAGVSQVFLAGPARSLNVRAGEVIDGQWRVERIAPTGLQLLWLPAKLPVNVAFRPAP